MAKGSEFEFGMELVFAKSSYKNPSEIQKWAWSLSGELKNLKFAFSICAVVESSDFKFGTQLGFAN